MAESILCDFGGREANWSFELNQELKFVYPFFRFFLVVLEARLELNLD